MLICLFFVSGNGTLNKHAGIDFKQLSLLAKINENHSGEVLCTFLVSAANGLFFGAYFLISYYK